MSNQATTTDDGPAASTAPIKVNHVPFDAPWVWLDAGWKDLWENPKVSLGFGAAVSAAAFVILVGLTQLGWESMILVLAGGFLIIAPFIAVGLYDTSRRIKAGEETSLNLALTAGFRAKGQLIFMGAILLLIYLAWVRVALLLFALFLGDLTLPPASEFIPTLLFTPHGLGLLVVGTAVGAVFAALVFVITAVAVPMLLTRNVDAFTAMSHSIAAVRQNPKPMALWAVLIAGFIVLGIATLFFGVIFAFPLIAHATWHAYDAIISDA
ncbi:MAG: DUF2189 domain-containing protein [Pseudomonadota bacterium]